jgi:membrane protein required for colicin V production
MASTQINVFDAVVLCVFGLSALVAFFRGFLRELFSLGAWVGAAAVTLYLFPYSTEFVKQHMKGSDQVVAGAALTGTYIVALLVISIFNSVVIRYIKSGAEVGVLDNFLGLVFGAIRGAFILSLAYLLMTTVISKDNPPEWIKTSFTKQYLQAGADVLVKVAPKYLAEIEGVVKEEAVKQNNGEDAGEKGYKPENLQDFNRLIDSSQPQGADFHRGQ